MTIANPCWAHLVPNFNRDIAVALPEVGTDEEIVIDSSNDFVYSTTGGCERRFDYRLRNEVVNNVRVERLPELRINQTTGRMTLTTASNRKRCYDLDIIIRTTGCGDELVREVNVNICVVCGRYSTSVVPPNALSEYSPSVKDWARSEYGPYLNQRYN